MSNSGIKGLFAKKKQKATTAKVKEEQGPPEDDGEWLTKVPEKTTATVKVVTTGKLVDDYW